MAKTTNNTDRCDSICQAHLRWVLPQRYPVPGFHIAVQKSRQCLTTQGQEPREHHRPEANFRATGKTCFLNLNCISFRPHFEIPKDSQTVRVSFAILMRICPFPSSRTAFPVKQIQDLFLTHKKEFLPLRDFLYLRRSFIINVTFMNNSYHNLLISTGTSHLNWAEKVILWVTLAISVKFLLCNLPSTYSYSRWIND